MEGCVAGGTEVAGWEKGCCPQCSDWILAERGLFVRAGERNLL